MAAERNGAVRESWRAQNATLGADRLIVVDETSTSISLTRRYAWAPSTERAVGAVPRNHGIPTTLIASLTPDGLGPALTLAGAVTTDTFYVYVRDFLGPSLRPGQVVLLDNLSAHKAAAVRELIEARGCEVLYLPPYSPDFSPIELAFAKLKAFLRRVGARTQEALDAALHEAVDLISPTEAHNFIRHRGYRFPAEL